MKIRSAKIFNVDLTEVDIKKIYTDGRETIESELVFSNNECSRINGEESEKEDSPQSFLVKQQASHRDPPTTPTSSFSGLYVPDNEDKNEQEDDDESPFKSVNINHYNYTLKDQSELDALTEATLEQGTIFYKMEFKNIWKYMYRHKDDEEWLSYLTMNGKEAQELQVKIEGLKLEDPDEASRLKKLKSRKEKWARFRLKAIKKKFITTHCEIKHNDIELYLKKASKVEVVKDVEELKKYDVIKSPDEKKALSRFFPEVYDK